MLHRLSGIALAIFLPLHFLALATALNGAEALDAFLALTRQPLVMAAEFGIVVALAIHMTLGLRVLAIEFFDFREKTLVAALGLPRRRVRGRAHLHPQRRLTA